MYSVLVIDDDISFAENASEELACEGFLADKATSYTQAIECLHKKKYDVVSLDVMMAIGPTEDIDREAANFGRRTGLLLYKEIRDIQANARIVICSVLAASELGMAKIREVAATETVLAKPVGLSAYIAAIRKAAVV